MKYRNQYISSNLGNNSELSISIDHDYLNDINPKIDNLYIKLIKNLEDLSTKVDRGFNENKYSINLIEERLIILEQKSLSLSEIDKNKNIQNKSKDLFENNLRKINNIDNSIFNSENKNYIFSLNNDSLSYNNNWEEEFNKKGLSLEDDGIYEYDDEGEDMKYDYYNGELPKTKIVKIRGSDNIQTYTKDDISEFIENESKKLALNEVSKLHSQSETTQKAWLANNQRLVELTKIIEAQEKEIRRLSQNVKNNSSINENEVSEMISNSALKILRDEYELRISALEKNNGISNNSNEIKNVLNQLQKEKEENLKLKSLLDEKNINNNPKVEVVVSTAPNNLGIQTNVSNKPILDSGRKRKQKYFFEIIEHNTPKITKADLEK